MVEQARVEAAVAAVAEAAAGVVARAALALASPRKVSKLGLGLGLGLEPGGHLVLVSGVARALEAVVARSVDLDSPVSQNPEHWLCSRQSPKLRRAVRRSTSYCVL